MPRSSCTAALAASLLLSVPAAADELWQGGISEVAHDVEARVSADRVELAVRRAFVNRGPRRQGVWLSIDLPEGAVARELRVRTGGQWHQAALLDAATAEKRYYSEKPGPSAPDQDPALLSWESRGRLALRVHAIDPGALAAVEYRLLLPARAEGGKLHFSYPLPDGERLVMPAIRVIPPHPGDRVWIGDEAITPGIARPLSLEPLAPRSGASALSSPVEVTGPPADLADARVRVFASHRRYSDLAFELRGPGGEVQALPGDRDRLIAGVDIAPRLLEYTAGTWKLVVRDRVTGESGTLHGWRVELTGTDGHTTSYRSRRPLAIPDALFDAEERESGAVDVAVASHPARLEAGYGRVALAGGGAVFRFHVDAPAMLGAVPDDLRVVFVLDASRSMSPEDTAEQLDLVAAYLEQAPKARFEVVRFDRRARRLLGRFAAAGDFATIRGRLEKSDALKRQNGSALERGLAVAARALASAGGTPRIVVVSDLLVRSRFRGAMAARALRRARGAVLHLTTLGGADGPYERLDGHRLAGVAAARGGMTVSLPTGDAEALRRGALALIRPIQIDHLAISGPAGATAPERLGEGRGLRFFDFDDKSAPDAVTLGGLLWQRPVHRVVAAGRAEGDRVAALAFGDRVFDALTQPQIAPLARRGHVVSPATSLLTTRPGERARLGFGRIFGGSSCTARCGGVLVGHGTIHPVRRPLDLAAPLRRCAARLPAGAPLDAVALVETSYREIVDVDVQAAAPLARCLTEEIWKLELAPAQSAGPLHMHRIELSRSSLRSPGAAAAP